MKPKNFLKMRSCFGCGRSSIMPGGAGDWPSARAGRASVAMFIQRIWRGSTGKGKPITVSRPTAMIVSKFAASMNLMKARMLW